MLLKSIWLRWSEERESWKRGICDGVEGRGM